jgi:two-component system response regulator HydG
MPGSSEKERILIVDDAPATVEVLQRNLSSAGYQTFTAASVQEAIGILDSTPVDLVITDLKIPKVSGLDLIRHVRENFQNTEVMMITGYASIEGAVEAIKTGAEEYLAKPFTDEELFAAVQRALDKLHLRRATHAWTHRTPRAPHGLIGESPPMLKVFDSIAKAASSVATLLITGESGTGKELVARAIHYSSPRSSAPFIPVSCGAIPEGLLESELFGYVKGAFTGASESRAGFFQTADGGTIFLDEISETSLSMQVKLLRVLQDREVMMVGSTVPRKVDVRILAATNKSLPALVKKGVFREDLFYRLDVLTIELPALRERGNDILLLAQHFAVKFAEELGKPTPKFSDRTLKVLHDYDWPGNVRELENVIQRLVVMNEGDTIEVADLPNLKDIRSVLESVGGNKSRAAKILGIDRKTLREKLARHPMPE